MSHLEADHILVILVRGLCKKYKQIVAWHYTGSSVDGNSMKDVLIELIIALKVIDLRIFGLVSDMGPSNRSLWISLQIVVNQFLENPIISFEIEAICKCVLLLNILI